MSSEYHRCNADGTCSVEAPHVCRCSNCFDFGLPSAPEVTGHIGLRFGLGDDVRRQAKPYLDGEYMQHCAEARPGIGDGFVVVYAEDPAGGVHACKTCRAAGRTSVCMEVRRGRVEVHLGDEVYR